MPTPLEEMRTVAKRLQPLEIPFTFIGGAVLGLLVDDPKLSEVRSTKDVDVVVEVVTYGEYMALEERLRQARFQYDTSQGAPICRWIIDGCLVDILPKDSAALGMNSKWFHEVLACSKDVDLGEGCVARVITPALFLATKLEAFKDRGKGDYLMSRDLGDIVTLIDGRATIVEDVAGALAAVRSCISKIFLELLKDPYFHEALPENLPRMEGTSKRVALVTKRFEAIATA